MPRYSAEQIYAYAVQAGFDPHSATTMTAVAMAESRGNSDAHATHGEDSRGLWQINARAHHDLAERYDLWNPADNARAAFEVSRGGHDVSPWTTTHGGSRASYLRFRTDAESAAVAHGETPGLGVWTGTKGYGHPLAASPELAHGAGGARNPDPPDAGQAPEQVGEGAGHVAAVADAEGTGTAAAGSGVELAAAPQDGGPIDLGAGAAPDHAPVAEPGLVTEAVVVPLADDHADALTVEADAAVVSSVVAGGAVPVFVEPAQPEPTQPEPTHGGPTPPEPVAGEPPSALVSDLSPGQFVPLSTPEPAAPITPQPAQPVAAPPPAVPPPAPAPEPASSRTHLAADDRPDSDRQAGELFLAEAMAQKGDAYVMGAQARLSDPDPSVFDCAELVRWAAHREGVEMPDGSWIQYLHLKELGAVISVEEAERTPGALLFSFTEEPTPGGGRPTHSHVAISDGQGGTIEARGRAYGVGTWEAGNRFEYAAVIPEFASDSPAPAAPPVQPSAPAPAESPGAPGLASPAHGGAVIDTDRDGLDDVLERSLRTDPFHNDTDRDGLRDARELLYTHTDPLVADDPSQRFDAVIDSAGHDPATWSDGPGHTGDVPDGSAEPGGSALGDLGTPDHGDAGVHLGQPLLDPTQHGHPDPAQHPGDDPFAPPGTPADGVRLDRPVHGDGGAWDDDGPGSDGNDGGHHGGHHGGGGGHHGDGW